MTDAEHLQAIFRRENRSFLQYVHDSSPWASEQDEALRSQILSLADEEQSVLQEFAESLEAEHIPLPYLGSFPMAFTSFNFIAIRALIRPLLFEVRKSVEQLTTESSLFISPRSREAIERLRELKQKHLRILEGLAESTSAPKSA